MNIIDKIILSFVEIFNKIKETKNSSKHLDTRELNDQILNLIISMNGEEVNKIEDKHLCLSLSRRGKELVNKIWTYIYDYDETKMETEKPILLYLDRYNHCMSLTDKINSYIRLSDKKYIELNKKKEAEIKRKRSSGDYSSIGYRGGGIYTDVNDITVKYHANHKGINLHGYKL